MEDKTFTCCDCKKEFVWTVDQQKYFKEIKLDKEPVRCRECAIALRDKRKAEAQAKEKSEQNATPSTEPEKNTAEPTTKPAKQAKTKSTNGTKSSTNKKDA